MSIPRAAWALPGLLAGFPLAAQGAWSFGGQVHLAAPLGETAPSLRQDLRGHLGAGTGLSAEWEATARQRVRASLDFLGSRVNAWPGDEADLNDIWRTLRLGAEHVVMLGPSADSGPYAFYGGGWQNAWVNRTEGSLGEVTLLAALYAVSGATSSSRYNVQSTALDSYAPFATAGIGWQFRIGASVELRWIAASYLRFTAEGLQSSGRGPTERRAGSQIVLSVRAWRAY